MNDVWLFTAILGAALLLFVTQWIRLEVTALLVISSLALTGLLDVDDAFAGFSSSATLTVAAMLVISAGLQRAAVVDVLADRLVLIARGGKMRLFLALAIPTAAFSAFMNNTAIVALMIPVAITVSTRFKLAPSKLLLPISYMAILGGTCTLIGTSTNVLVHALWTDAGGAGFSMFEFGKMGIAYLAIGALYVTFARRLLPEREPPVGLQPAAHGRFVTELRVAEDSRFVGKKIKDALEGAEEVKVLQLLRDEEARANPSGDEELQNGDAILIEASARTIHRLLAGPAVDKSEKVGAVEVDEEGKGKRRLDVGTVDLHTAEAMITPTSSYRYRSIRELRLNRRYGVQVLAVRRLGKPHRYDLRDFRLRSGDVMLVQGSPEALRILQHGNNVLLVEGVHKSLAIPKKAPLALLILAAVVTLALLDVAPIAALAIAGATAMMLVGVLHVRAAMRALDSSVLLLLAGTIPLGLAMERTGVAAHMADFVADAAAPYGAFVMISALYLLTSILTEVLSNNATAVLLVPIVLGVADRFGISPEPFLMAIAFGGSASFATPIGYQTNTMVMGPGGYLFRDYLRFGLPMNLLMWIAASLLIPVFWPPHG